MINVRIYFGVYFEHLKCACYTTEGVLVVHSYICLFIVTHLTWRRLFHWGALGFWSRRGGGEVSVQGISGGLDARETAATSTGGCGIVCPKQAAAGCVALRLGARAPGDAWRCPSEMASSFRVL
jgi:hypothetical protein